MAEEGDGGDPRRAFVGMDVGGEVTVIEQWEWRRRIGAIGFVEDHAGDGEEKSKNDEDDKKGEQRAHVALAVFARVSIPGDEAEVPVQPADSFVFARAVQALHLHFAVVEVAGGPVVLTVIVILFQLLVDFSDEAVVALVGLVWAGGQVAGGLEIDAFLKELLLAVGARSPIDGGEVEAGNVAIVEAGLTQPYAIKDGGFRAGELGERKDGTGEKLGILAELSFAEFDGSDEVGLLEVDLTKEFSADEMGVLREGGDGEISVLFEGCKCKECLLSKSAEAEICLIIENFKKKFRIGLIGCARGFFVAGRCSRTRGTCPSGAALPA